MIDAILKQAEKPQYLQQVKREDEEEGAPASCIPIQQLVFPDEKHILRFSVDKPQEKALPKLRTDKPVTSKLKAHKRAPRMPNPFPEAKAVVNTNLTESEKVKKVKSDVEVEEQLALTGLKQQLVDGSRRMTDYFAKKEQIDEQKQRDVTN